MNKNKNAYLQIFATAVALTLVVIFIASSYLIKRVHATTVQLAVAPIHTIIVDSQNNIISITSNTPNSVLATLLVIRDNNQGEQIPITPKIFGQYQSIAAENDLDRIGVIYTKSTPLYSQIVLLANFYKWLIDGWL